MNLHIIYLKMYTSLISIFSLSFLLGMRHATDADHVIAITTLVSRQKKGIISSGFIGLLWGIGHSITVTLIAIPVIFNVFKMPENLGSSLELIVGIMLIILGLLNLSGLAAKLIKKFIPITVHKHLHLDNREGNHSHIHIHPVKLHIKENFHHIGIFQSVRPIIVGLVHGLAGSAAIALLILSTIHQPFLAIFYLLIFHIGILTGMMLISLTIGASVIIAKRKSMVVKRYLSFTSGALSLIFGLFIIYHIIFS